MAPAISNHLRSVLDLTSNDVEDILNTAQEYRSKLRDGIRRENLLDGRVVALIFEKPSLRTAMTFEIATHALGGVPVFLSSSQILASGSNQQGRESIPDIGRNVERFADLIVARVYKHDTIQQLANSVNIPVINALCDLHHPCQALADLLTIRSFFPLASKQKKIQICFVGDGNNVATSLMQICALMGLDFTVSCPKGYEIPLTLWDDSLELAEQSGAILKTIRDPQEAVISADIVYTDTFISMGHEEERVQRLTEFSGYQVNQQLMSHAKPNAKFMHCLPAHRGEEVTDQVIDSSHSIVFDQAESRLHIAKALLHRFHRLA